MLRARVARVRLSLCCGRHVPFPPFAEGKRAAGTTRVSQHGGRGIERKAQAQAQARQSAWMTKGGGGNVDDDDDAWAGLREG